METANKLLQTILAIHDPTTQIFVLAMAALVVVGLALSIAFMAVKKLGGKS
ncbi:hypothetical protein H8K38_02365 [Undibacterium sp. FT79W]|uniref:hypothetical protein n=1 Tax=Undibacterium sp. FT79W TaxID=2762296 RepID=UPI00164C901C|nr:hypothetical protein [Undibacterium sp. FT79W]MBC3876645.1 hypothetical protein [Undibacterium sp. FT79W]